MKTIEILSEMNIHFDEATDSLFDYILECKKITTLDMFPKLFIIVENINLLKCFIKEY